MPTRKAKTRVTVVKTGLKVYHWFGLLTAFVVWLDLYFPFLKQFLCNADSCTIASIDSRLPAAFVVLGLVGAACGVWNYGRKLLSTDTSAQLYGWVLLYVIYAATWVRGTVLFANDFIEAVRSSVERNFIINNLTLTVWLGLFFFWWMIGTILLYQFSMYGVYLWRKHNGPAKA